MTSLLKSYFFYLIIQIKEVTFLIQRIAKQSVLYLATKTREIDVTQSDYEVYLYGMEIFISTSLSMMVLFLIDIYTGKVPQSIMYFVLFGLLRKFCGGYKFDGNYKLDFNHI